MKLFNKTSIAVAVALISGQTFAAGFQINAQSATGIGRALSGDAAIGDNASVLARNPAAMSLFKNSALSSGLTYVQADVKVKDVEPEVAGLSYVMKTMLLPINLFLTFIIFIP